MLIVLSGPSEQPATDAMTAAAQMSRVQPGPQDRQSIPDLLIDPSAAAVEKPGAAQWTLPETRTSATMRLAPVGGNVAPSPRKTKRQTNPAAEFAKIAIGGCIGLLIGCAILIWIFNDPLKLAKHLPAFMAPEQNRSEEGGGKTNAGPEPQSRSTAPRQAPEATSTVKRVDPFANDLAAGDVTHERMPTSAPDASAATNPPIVRGPKTEITYGPSDALTALAATNEAAAQLVAAEKNQTDDAEIDDSRQRFVASLTKLAEATSLLRGESGDVRAAQAAAGEVLRNLFSDREKLATLGARGAAEFASTMRTANGIVLAGTIEEVRSLGDHFRTFLRLPGGGSSISVITSDRPTVSAGDTAIIAGYVVDDPKQGIAGYEGPDERVIWAGFIVKSGVSLGSDHR